MANETVTMTMKPGVQQVSPYPTVAYPDCVVYLMSPGGALEMTNIGGGTFLNPITGAALLGDNIVCSLAAAQDLVNRIKPVIGNNKLTALLADSVSFPYVNVPGLPTGVTFGVGPNQVNIYTLVDQNNFEYAGNIQEMIIQQNERGFGCPGHWMYTDIEEGTKLQFKFPQLQWVWD